MKLTNPQVSVADNPANKPLASDGSGCGSDTPCSLPSACLDN